MMLAFDSTKDESDFEGVDYVFFDVSMRGGQPKFDDDHDVQLSVVFMDGTRTDDSVSGVASVETIDIHLEAKLNPVALTSIISRSLCKAMIRSKYWSS